MVMVGRFKCEPKFYTSSESAVGGVRIHSCFYHSLQDLELTRAAHEWSRLTIHRN